jgi:thiosulfate dehydrogenase [quinone] large subunit
MDYTNQTKGLQLYSLVAVRIFLGWYFLYEGVIKIFTPGWSAYGFLKSSQGPLRKLFIDLADHSAALVVINHLNIWGLIAIGLGLILGVLTRVASVSGAILVLLYYLSHPPIIDAHQLAISTEHTMWVDKNLIFMAILMVMYAFPTGRIIGVDRFLFNKRG